MTAKEKASELYYRFTIYAPLHENNKQCALIAVDEILNEVSSIFEIDPTRDFWNEVKKEIEKI